MSQREIPDNNLPVYLQKYKVYIFNKNYPDCKTTCASSEAGCCADDVTPVSPGGCPVDGCAGTEFGCCPFSTEAKKSPFDTCDLIAGTATYNTVGAIPSNKAGKRVWELNLSGELEPNHPVYYIVYDFQRVDYKDKITFENIVTGTLNICGRVLDATKYTEKSFCDGNRTLTIKIDTRKWDFRFRKKVRFSYRLNVDDTSYCGAGNSTCNVGEDCTITTGDIDSTINVLFSEQELQGYLPVTVKSSTITVNNGEGGVNQNGVASDCGIVSVSGSSVKATIGGSVTFNASYNYETDNETCTYTQSFKLTYKSSTAFSIVAVGNISSNCKPTVVT